MNPNQPLYLLTYREPKGEFVPRVIYTRERLIAYLKERILEEKDWACALHYHIYEFQINEPREQTDGHFEFYRHGGQEDMYGLPSIGGMHKLLRWLDEH